MHILLLTNDFPRTWNPTHYVFYGVQAKALSKAGHQVGVLVEPQIRYVLDYVKEKRFIPSPIALNFYEKTIPVYRTNWGLIPKSSPKLRATGKLFALWHTFQKYCKHYGRPDIIHAHNTIYSGYLASLIGKEQSIPTILTEHFTGYWRGIITEAQLELVKSAFTNVNQVLAVSDALADTLTEITDTKKSIGVIGNIVDVNFFFHKPINVSEGSFRFASITSFHPKKSVDKLLKAFQPIAIDYNAHLYLAGDGNLLSQMRQLTRHLGIESNVHFMGRLTRDEVRNLIHESHCIVSSSQYETFGITLIEAMSCGRPVIATQSGGPEMFVNHRNGILVPKEDSDSLSDAMQRMIATIDSYNSIEIRRECVDKFSEPAIVQTLEEIYFNTINASE